jgi:Na+/H+-translocating membrane pyrophosphatase
MPVTAPDLNATDNPAGLALLGVALYYTYLTRIAGLSPASREVIDALVERDRQSGAERLRRGLRRADVGAYRHVHADEAGHARAEGAQAYLRRQYATIGIVGVVLFGLLAWFLGLKACRHRAA